MSRESFFSALEHGQVAKVKEMIRQSPKLVSAEDQWGSTALNRAVSMNDVDLVKFLIAAKGDVNHDSHREGRPLCSACYFGQREVVQVLLDAHADVNLQSKQPTHDVGTALHAAAQGGHLEIVSLIVSRGADVNAHAMAHYLVTPLHQALGPEPESSERPKIVRFLLEHGADPNAKDSRGFTPWDQAKALYRDAAEEFSRTPTPPGNTHVDREQRVLKELEESCGILGGVTKGKGKEEADRGETKKEDTTD